MNNINLYWIRHAQSLSNLNINNSFIHPFLSYLGLQQSYNLGNTLLDNKYDIVYCSASLRTILTAIISITKYNNKSENKIKKIKIIPYICEKMILTDVIYKFNIKILNKIANKYNKQNNIIEYNKLIKITKESINWINSNILIIFYKKKIIDILENELILGNIINNEITKIINNIKIYDNDDQIRNELNNLIINNGFIINNIKKIKKILDFKFDYKLLDFSYLIENTIKYNNFKKSLIYDFLFKEIEFEKNNNLLIFSHKNYIKRLILPDKYKINNCDIIIENGYYNKNKINIIKRDKINNMNNKINNKEINFLIKKSIQKYINSVI